MAEESKEKGTKIPKTKKSDLIGHQAQPTVLNDTTKLDVDIDRTLMDHMIMAGLSHKVDTQELDKFTSISDSRELIYQLIDVMCQDSTVSSIVRTYTEDVCETADSGHIIWAESNDPKISKHINYLLNVSNVDKNIYGWVYNLIKYGDVYLKLFRESDYEDELFHKTSLDTVRKSGRLHEDLDESIILSTHAENDSYSYYVEMVPDPSTMFELTKYGKTYGYIEVPNDTNLTTNQEGLQAATGLGTSAQNGVGAYNYKMKRDDVIIHQADEYVHAYLDDGYTRFPETIDIFLPDDESQTNDAKSKYANKSLSYTVRRGKSLLYDAYKIWREKQLLEAAALLSRLTRSSVIRKVGVEMGNTSKEKSAQILRSVKEMFEQKTSYNTGSSMSEYNNPSAIENFIYHVIRDGKGAITVDTIGGDYDPKQLTDLDWWNNKFYSAFGIPKQYFGWTDDGAGFNGGTALTVLSSVYGKGVKRVQNAMIQALSTMIDLFLVKSGCKAFLNNYVLKMKFPLTQEEISYRENFTNRVNAVSSTNSLFTDVETKSTRLAMLKALVSTLNYGDELLGLIDDEISVAKEAEAKAKEAEEAAELEGAEGSATDDGLNLDLGDDSGDAGAADAGAADDLNLDNLGDIPAAPDTPQESFKASPALTSLTEDTEFLDESTDLPNPDDLEDIDFSKNN